MNAIDASLQMLSVENQKCDDTNDDDDDDAAADDDGDMIPCFAGDTKERHIQFCLFMVVSGMKGMITYR